MHTRAERDVFMMTSYRSIISKRGALALCTATAAAIGSRRCEAVVFHSAAESATASVQASFGGNPAATASDTPPASVGNPASKSATASLSQTGGFCSGSGSFTSGVGSLHMMGTTFGNATASAGAGPQLTQYDSTVSVNNVMGSGLFTLAYPV